MADKVRATTDPTKVTTANPATTTYLDGEHESMLTNLVEASTPSEA